MELFFLRVGSRCGFSRNSDPDANKKIQKDILANTITITISGFVFVTFILNKKIQMITFYLK